MPRSREDATIMKLLWVAFGSTWLVFISFGVWAAKEHGSIRDRVADLDRDQSVQMMKLETELKHINTTLLEIKERISKR